eukprot:Polyplicarium_translucidae@DN2730_c0_g1_i3.p3
MGVRNRDIAVVPVRRRDTRRDMMPRAEARLASTNANSPVCASVTATDSENRKEWPEKRTSGVRMRSFPANMKDRSATMTPMLSQMKMGSTTSPKQLKNKALHTVFSAPSDDKAALLYSSWI